MESVPGNGASIPLRSYERFSRQKWGRLCRCRKSVGCTTTTNDRLPEKAKTHRATRCISLGFEICAQTVSLGCVHQRISRSSDPGTAATRLSLRFVLKIRLPNGLHGIFRRDTYRSQGQQVVIEFRLLPFVDCGSEVARNLKITNVAVLVRPIAPS